MVWDWISSFTIHGYNSIRTTDNRTLALSTASFGRINPAIRLFSRPSSTLSVVIDSIILCLWGYGDGSVPPHRHKEMIIGSIGKKRVDDGRENNGIAGLIRRQETVKRVSVRSSAVFMQLYPSVDRAGRYPRSAGGRGGWLWKRRGS